MTPLRSGRVAVGRSARAAWTRRPANEHAAPSAARVALEGEGGAHRGQPQGAQAGRELKIIETRVYRGPNYWSYEPAIKLVVDLGVLEQFPTNTIPGFVEGLLEMLPEVGSHSCGTGRAGGFAGRLREGTWVGPRGRAHRAAAAARGGHRGRPRQDPQHRRAGAVPRRLLVRRGERRAWRPGGWRCGWSTTSSGRARLRLPAPSSRSWSCWPSARRSARRPRPSSTRPRCATSRPSA